MGYRVVDVIAEHLTSLPGRPVFRPLPPEVAAAFLAEPAPHAGSAPEAILDEFGARVEPYPFGNGHPRFWGWVNPPPEVMAIFAAALAAAMNPSVAGGNHAAVYVEHQVLNWFKTLLGFPETAMGLLVSGGSMATLTGLAVARHVAAREAGIDVRARGLQDGGAPFVVYMGEEGHSCIRKAVELLGIGSDQLRVIASDDRFRLPPAALEAHIRRDLAAGLRPVAVVASAGTVNTGAIDPLADLAAVCRRYRVWLHVDGAYGAPAILAGAYRAELQALALADSLALDPHKWLYVPVEAGLVMVRDGPAMRDAFSLVPPYLRTDGSPTGVGGPPWFSEFGLEQTRGFRALKVWMALKHQGLDGYRALVEHDLALAAHLAARVAASPDLELMARGLSVVCFRFAPPALRADPQGLDRLNQALLQAMQLGGQAFLSSTTLRGSFVLRACLINPRTTVADVDALVDLVRQTGARLAGQGLPQGNP
ncbi:MAG TPA: aminotransferase class V-fold PLP-dependent enzyme [Chloroflexota bacterium]|nr:aminotransferase class V-fold PLP-dependent enzyme [Chloroflexota bacterium]